MTVGGTGPGTPLSLSLSVFLSLSVSLSLCLSVPLSPSIFLRLCLSVYLSLLCFCLTVSVHLPPFSTSPSVSGRPVVPPGLLPTSGRSSSTTTEPSPKIESSTLVYVPHKTPVLTVPNDCLHFPFPFTSSDDPHPGPVSDVPPQ